MKHKEYILARVGHSCFSLPFPPPFFPPHPISLPSLLLPLLGGSAWDAAQQLSAHRQQFCLLPNR